jgi:hypothetical protein
MVMDLLNFGWHTRQGPAHFSHQIRSRQQLRRKEERSQGYRYTHTKLLVDLDLQTRICAEILLFMHPSFI